MTVPFLMTAEGAPPAEEVVVGLPVVVDDVVVSTELGPVGEAVAVGV